VVSPSAADQSVVSQRWTLQELLAPRNVRFYDSEWQYLGTKAETSGIIEKTTGIPRYFLVGIAELCDASIA
jgi:hypothetical protein